MTLRSACLGVGLAVAALAMVAIPARATYGARTTSDEPQYLLSALSLAEDRDLWIDDELAARRYRPFHEVTLPVQTEVRPNGREVSPHDPLLPAVLALPMGIGGWAAAKAALSLIGGVLAGLLTWIAHRRLAVPLVPAALTVLAFGLTAPFTTYASQVYPELPAALAVTAGIAALTTPERLGKAAVLVLAGGVVVLPWLGVKYAPVAAILALLGLARLWRERQQRALVWAILGLGGAGVVYLVVHRLLYGGWTVYAAGDHFVEGELTVVGNDPRYLGRTRRLAGLLLDRGFGLAAWMPGYLLAVPALGALLRRRPHGWSVLVLPLAAGWATATWVALTMHGWWWPGRQTVVVLPCLILAVAWWAGQATQWRIPMVLVTAVVGLLSWLALVVEVLRRQRTLIVDFETTSNPVYRLWRAVLPDYRHPGLDDWLLQAMWLAALGLWLAVPYMTRRSSDVPA
jgi:hypothetical protein